MVRVPSNDKPCLTPSPPPYERRVYTPPSPNMGARRATISSGSPSLSPVRTPPGSPTAENPRVRFMNSRGPVDKEGGRNGRPKVYRSPRSNPEFSTIDLKWGLLFDGDSNPTPRLKQFLKGLANHLIEYCHPRKSIVVIPDKMAAFYENHGVENEVYPLVTVFKSQISQNYANLSNLYQELECQHFLVQDEPFAKPMIPALTPEGFAHWMTMWIRAYPDQEAKRLEKVVVSTPIDADGENVDGKPERLPKQISRHLLPSREDPESKKLICDAITIFLDELGMSRTRKPSITSHSLTQQTSATAQSRIQPINIPQISPASIVPDRDQMQYQSPSDAVFIKESPNIERDRQPYTAKPGSTLDQLRSRRNTFSNPSQLPAETTSPRNSERWNQMYENRDREKVFELKSAGQILHEEFRPDVRPVLSDSPDEEWYLRAPPPSPPSTRARAEQPKKVKSDVDREKNHVSLQEDIERDIVGTPLGKSEDLDQGDHLSGQSSKFYS
jgi:hypothetical protein